MRFYFPHLLAQSVCFQTGEMVRRIGFLLGVGLFCTTALASSQVGFRQFNLTNDIPERALNVLGLYPTVQDDIATIKRFPEWDLA